MIVKNGVSAGTDTEKSGNLSAGLRRNEITELAGLEKKHQSKGQSAFSKDEFKRSWELSLIRDGILPRAEAREYANLYNRVSTEDISSPWFGKKELIRFIELQSVVDNKLSLADAATWAKLRTEAEKRGACRNFSVDEVKNYRRLHSIVTKDLPRKELIRLNQSNDTLDDINV